MSQRENFYSKILLFGEYALMAGSPALSIPYSDLHGAFAFRDSVRHSGFDSNSHLKKYAGYLRELSAEDFEGELDISGFEKDIANGLVFESNIPLGYGLGSSGSLVAAVYERYGLDKIAADASLSGEKLAALKHILALMESWFHGKSSGLDPLICYLQKAVMAEGNDKLRVVDLPKFNRNSEGAMFLLDTGMAGETQPLVDYFLAQCEKTDFLDKIKSGLIPLNDLCINAFLAGDLSALFSGMEELSAFTFQYFQPMIPEKVLPFWKKGVESKEYFLKLCGSGGGGMMLGFTHNFEQTKDTLKAFPIKIIQQF